MEGDMDPIGLGVDDPGEDVAIVRTATGRALVLPRSMRRLDADQADTISDLQHAAVKVSEAQALVDRLVQEARHLGCSWNVIGWSTGLTDRGAAKRWGNDGD